MDLEQLKKFFFRASLQGWASGNDGEPMPDFPNWRKISYTDSSGFIYTDQWGRDPTSGKTTGSTLIMYGPLPAWAMWYGYGDYEEGTLPALRTALMHNYKKGNFHGGRGPRRFPYGDLIYINECQGDFLEFGGIEQIVGDKRRTMGFHRYRGGSLLIVE